jgi:DNA polymerase/3'-5' exonuclease PolX
MWAKRKGFRLNQHRICKIEHDIPGEDIEVKSEEDVFAVMQLEYKHPIERNV